MCVCQGEPGGEAGFALQHLAPCREAASGKAEARESDPLAGGPSQGRLAADLKEGDGTRLCAHCNHSNQPNWLLWWSRGPFLFHVFGFSGCSSLIVVMALPPCVFPALMHASNPPPPNPGRHAPVRASVGHPEGRGKCCLKCNVTFLVHRVPLWLPGQLSKMHRVTTEMIHVKA